MGGKELLILLLWAVVCQGSDNFDPKDTIVLDENNFSQVKDDTWMVMFWAPWCAHCRRVKPLFAEASEKVKKGVSLGMVDCTADNGKPVCDALGVTSYPTFKYSIPGEEMMKYDGPRQTEDFIRFIDRLGDPSVHVLKFNAADIQELQKRDDVNVFVFCTPEGQITPHTTWLARRGLTFGRSHFGTHPIQSTLCDSKQTAFLINDIGTTEIHIPTDENEEGNLESIMTGDLDLHNLKIALDWIEKHKHLTVDRIDQATFHHLTKSNKTFLAMYVSAEGEWDDQRPYLEVLRKLVGKSHAERVSFGWLCGVLYAEWVADLVSVDTLPTVLVYNLDEESVLTTEEMRIAVHHAVKQRGDHDGAMEAAVDDLIEGIHSGRYQMTYKGHAGIVLGAAQRFAPFLLPHLNELRRATQSDLLFMCVISVVVVLIVCT